MAVTKLANLVDVEVMADLVDAKLTDNIVFGDVADIDTTLEGVPGSTLKFPVFGYIGDASVVTEGVGITPAQLTATTDDVQIVKYGVAVEITDEAMLSGVGDPIGQASMQVALAIDSAVDNAILATLVADVPSAMIHSTTADPKDTDILDALELFGEDIDGIKFAYVSPALYTQMRKNVNNWIPASQIAGELAVKGVVGEYGGCLVKVSNKLKTSKEAFIVKPGALKVVLKRGTNVEADRDILKKETVISADLHGATYLYNPAKAIRVKKA